MFLLQNGLSSVISIHHQGRFVCMILMHRLLTLNRSLFQLFCLMCFLPNQIMICSTSAAHVLLVLFCLLNPSALAADFEQVIIPVIYFLPCLLTRYSFVSCQQHMCHRFCLLCIYNKLAAFEQLIVPVLLYLTLFVN